MEVANKGVHGKKKEDSGIMEMYIKKWENLSSYDSLLFPQRRASSLHSTVATRREEAAAGVGIIGPEASRYYSFIVILPIFCCSCG